MSVVSVKPKDFILALFIRDDNERFLLGDNGYDFMDSQLHFAANTIENDEVEKQGADGTMLAGQVRRASVQTFDGYVGDATTPKETIEEMRRAFLAFFLKGHHYRVVYVDTARNTWQRKGGYLVDAPEVKELFQIHPEYHVGLNFEDVNYYSYDENADGDEITANLVQVAISSAVEGGLVWDEDGAVSEDATVVYDGDTATASGTSITISDAVEAPLSDFKLKGETSQQTYTGKNLVDGSESAITQRQRVTSVASGNGFSITSTSSSGACYVTIPIPNINSLLGKTVKCSYNASGSGTRLAFYYTNSGYAQDLVPGESGGVITLPASLGGYEGIGLVFYTGNNQTSTYTNIQLELGSIATSFEPYVGGVPAPNPDYPQAVQTVTGENVVKICGKNLLDVKNNLKASDGGLNFSYSNDKLVVSGTPTRSYANVTNEINTFLAAGQYTLSLSEAVSHRVYIWVRYTDGAAASLGIINAGGTSVTTTFAKDVAQIRLDFSVITTGVALSESFSVQLEKGSSASSFEPYQEQSYPISLGSIELCKLGDYEDYIYKSGDDWYVHKECGVAHLPDDLSAVGISDTNTVGVKRFGIGITDSSSVLRAPTGRYPILCSILQPGDRGDTYAKREVIGYGIDGTGVYRDFSVYIAACNAMTASQFQSWLGSNPLDIAYILATPTDTEITNEALVAQLEAVLSQGRTYADTNNIALIPSGNEQGSLEITYYTKYIVNITAGGYEWEQGGSGGPTVIMNDSIDYVYPIWTITGPITNPVLENTTTGEQIEYIGTISDGQTLVIDMGEQTALLDGLNVLSSVAGEFISLAPGANTLLYSASSGNEPSEIGWSEIVG